MNLVGPNRRYWAVAILAAVVLASCTYAVSLPCCDPIRHGVGPIVDQILAVP